MKDSALKFSFLLLYPIPSLILTLPGLYYLGSLFCFQTNGKSISSNVPSILYETFASGIFTRTDLQHIYWPPHNFTQKKVHETRHILIYRNKKIYKTTTTKHGSKTELFILIFLIMKLVSFCLVNSLNKDRNEMDLI